MAWGGAETDARIRHRIVADTRAAWAARITLAQEIAAAFALAGDLAHALMGRQVARQIGKLRISAIGPDAAPDELPFRSAPAPLSTESRRLRTRFAHRSHQRSSGYSSTWRRTHRSAMDSFAC